MVLVPMRHELRPALQVPLNYAVVVTRGSDVRPRVRREAHAAHGVLVAAEHQQRLLRPADIPKLHRAVDAARGEHVRLVAVPIEAQDEVRAVPGDAHDAAGLRVSRVPQSPRAVTGARRDKGRRARVVLRLVHLFDVPNEGVDRPGVEPRPGPHLHRGIPRRGDEGVLLVRGPVDAHDLAGVPAGGGERRRDAVRVDRPGVVQVDAVPLRDDDDGGRNLAVARVEGAVGGAEAGDEERGRVVPGRGRAAAVGGAGAEDVDLAGAADAEVVGGAHDDLVRLPRVGADAVGREPGVQRERRHGCAFSSPRRQ
mmetsp:Transcript_9039/g.28032  ORF Transcript_9039/g.28032 Transcript_9039/m.28032 type:complete len:310 (-) Transcript_9039:16-945(-)